MRTKYLVVAMMALAYSLATANAECFGEGDYRVCSESYQDSNGDFHVRDGNNYAVDSETRKLPGGGTEINTSDSDGDSYSVKSWSDSSGVHTVDSDGNSCTITNSGVVIGCGE